MSSLVAYGSSDEDSDSSSDESQSRGLALPPPKVVQSKPLVTTSSTLGLPPPKVVQSEPLFSDTSTPVSMFASLPAPRRNNDITYIEEEDVVKPVAVKQKVKITIPALADLKDDEDCAPKAKKVKPTPKGSGLLSILPEPKHMSSRLKSTFMPHVLTKRPVAKPAVVKPAIRTNKALVTDYPHSDDDSGDEKEAAGTDFFSFSSHVAPEAAEINLEDLLPPTAGPSRPAPPPTPRVPSVSVSVSECQQQAAVHVADIEEPDLQLDDEAIRQLCGRRGKKEAMNVIDLHGNNMLPDPKDWMLKHMTEEQEMHGHRSSQPSSAHRRKHQITYLAFQAKEREIELKNQWSQNRMTKKQTQAKYGF